MRCGKWRDLLIAFAVATFVQLSPASTLFYRFIYLPICREPLPNDMLQVVRGVGWCFYVVVVWVAFQLMAFLVGNPPGDSL
jgi:hypothetical protein